ncbi:hypothetical protein ACF8GD_00250 [Pseudomonas putida]|uniref:hypothetical protein n=1 Tax=Pseudomonas putida TaxID=303 RepID=UPI00370A0C6A
MAREKAPVNKHQYVPLEERPEFLAVLAALPASTEVDALQQLAADSLDLFNDAVRGSAPEQAALAMLRYDAVVYRLHGDSFRGCGVDDGSRVRLERQLAAVPGMVPGWGQGGEWLVEVHGMRIRAKVDHGPRGTIPLELRAVDLGLPFLSPTGYRSHFLHYDQWLGRDLGAAVRGELERCLQEKDWQPVPIADKDKQWVKDMPAWLAPALEGVTRNGQQALPLSGRASVELPPAPIEAEAKAPMSNADRQREFRKRQKQKREQAKAEGVRTLELSDVDLGRIWIALDTHLAFNQLLDWDLEGHLQTAARLFADQPAAYLEQLGTSEGVVNQQKQRDKDAKRGWDAYKEERKRTDGLVGKVNKLQQENAELKAGLQEIAAEFAGAAVPTKPATDVTALQAEIDRLRAQLDKQHTENLNTIAELGKALTVTQAMQTRLKDAGLPHDYRQYLG